MIRSKQTVALQHTKGRGLIAVALLLCSAAPVAQATPERAAKYYDDALRSYEKQDLPATAIHLKNAIQQDGPASRDENIQVTALENCHYHSLPGDTGHGWQKSYALRIQTPDKIVVFSGDTGECGKRLSEFVRGASILVHEVVSLPAIERRIRSDRSTSYSDAQMAELMTHMREEHTTPEDIGRLATAAGVGQVVLSHLAPGSDELPDSAYGDGVRQFYSGPVTVAQDLMEFR